MKNTVEKMTLGRGTEIQGWESTERMGPAGTRRLSQRG